MANCRVVSHCNYSYISAANIMELVYSCSVSEFSNPHKALVSFVFSLLLMNFRMVLYDAQYKYVLGIQKKSTCIIG